MIELSAPGVGVAFAVITFLASAIGTYVALNVRLAMVESLSREAKDIAIAASKEMTEHIKEYHSNHG